jgi:hypothetical protein
MGILKTLRVTLLKDGTQALINATDFDPSVHRESAAPKKKVAKKERA